jgi:ketosteroid isomerase-like protein
MARNWEQGRRLHPQQAQQYTAPVYALPDLSIPGQASLEPKAMFERYTQKARLVIFFARYEASQYGSSFIEPDYLLLGLLREDPPLVLRFLGPNSTATNIRTAIEKQITRRERISTSVEMPLTDECKKILSRALEEADRLGQQRVGTEHILLGVLRAEGSVAARLLLERGVKVEAVRVQMAKTSGSGLMPQPSIQAIATLDSFLAGMKWFDWEQLVPFFAKNSQFIDSTGRRCIGRDEIEKQFEVLFAPYAKKNVTFRVESTDIGPAESLLASILWENVTVGGQSPKATHRMTIVLAPEGEDWAISLLQVTPIAEGPLSSGSPR